MKEIKKIDPSSVAKLTAVLYGILGLLFGWIPAISAFHSSGVFSAIMVWVAVVVGYAVLGLIGTAIAAFLYNFIAKKIGGIKIEIQ